MKNAFYNKPWAPGYALPAYERAESALTRGDARTTPWLPRGTISKVPPGYNHGGYAVPGYVLKEPVGSQAHTTPWLPRGTISNTKGLGIKTGLPWKGSIDTLYSNGLGSLGATPSKSGTSTVGGADPIVEYGKKAASLVTQDFKSLPPGQRDEAMRKLLDQVDPKLYGAYKAEAAKLVGLGVPPADAQQKGLAIAFSDGIAQEFIRLGKKKKAVRPGVGKGQVPLAALTGFDAQVNNYVGLGSVTSTVKDTLSKLGGLACDVATNPVTPIAAGSAGAFYGGPSGASLGVAGAGIAATACSSGGTGGAFPQQQPQGMPSWALPALIGGGALALVLVLRK